MSVVTGVERFLLAYVYYEYGGRVYFQASGERAEEFLAEFIAEEFLPRSNPNFSRVRDGFAEALRSLQEKGFIVMRGFELLLTDEGKRLAARVPQEEYQEVKKRFRSAK